MMVKMPLVGAGVLVSRIMEVEKAKGMKFQDHAFESLVNSVEIGIEEDKLYALIDAYMVPDGIKMPWGTWVKP